MAKNTKRIKMLSTKTWESGFRTGVNHHHTYYEGKVYTVSDKIFRIFTSFYPAAAIPFIGGDDDNR